MNKKTYILLSGKNNFESLSLILHGLIRRAGLMVITPPELPLEVKKIFGKHIKEYEAVIADYKGLWYTINKETIDLTLEFYNKEIRDKNRLISYYSRLLATDKFEAYCKKEISHKIFDLLKQLHAINAQDSLKGKEILANKDSINEFVIKYMEDKYKIRYRIKWVLPTWQGFLLFTYYGWLFMEFIKRGVVFNKTRKTYKISKEALLGFHPRTIRDDIIIDRDKFKVSDMLMLDYSNNLHNKNRNIAFKKAMEKGYDTASLPKLKININKNILRILSFYFWAPLKSFLQLLMSRQLYFFYYIFLFHKKAFPVELLMNLYDIKCHIATKDWGDIEEAITLNKYGTKTATFHWSDMTCYKAYEFAFVAHNIYFAWGNIHYDQHSENYSVDKKINIGCIFKPGYNKALASKEKIILGLSGFQNKKKAVAFCDTSFDNRIVYDERFFLEYLTLIRDFCVSNKGVNVLLKAKRPKRVLPLSAENRAQYDSLLKDLGAFENFIYIDPLSQSIEEIIALADVVVSMGMNTPSALALICAKPGLYFDSTGNEDHPFVKRHANRLVFKNKKSLFDQIQNILSGKLVLSDLITESEIREYDAYADDNALERLRGRLHEIVSSG